jgi:serine/threonine protein kinase
VEYAPTEESPIPLKAEKVLGYSNTALAESVICRRIRLARKTIRCTRRLSLKNAITEVEHLQRLHHAHIVRVVGIYTLRKNLAILLYPVAEWNLEEFVETVTEDPYPATFAYESYSRDHTLASFFCCLSNAVHFIHMHNIKHMDIKPKNLLIRRNYNDYAEYKIYIADFGIARSYLSAAEAETDSPTSYTPTYAAPEVVQQNKRGFKADIFSLGCVFMEILATIISGPTRNELLELRNLRLNGSGDTSYEANIEPVLAWLKGVASLETEGGDTTWTNPQFLDELHLTIQASPDSRPSASALALLTKTTSCYRCHLGPEPFEAAKPRVT